MPTAVAVCATRSFAIVPAARAAIAAAAETVATKAVGRHAGARTVPFAVRRPADAAKPDVVAIAMAAARCSLAAQVAAWRAEAAATRAVAHVAPVAHAATRAAIRARTRAATTVAAAAGIGDRSVASSRCLHRHFGVAPVAANVTGVISTAIRPIAGTRAIAAAIIRADATVVAAAARAAVDAITAATVMSTTACRPRARRSSRKPIRPPARRRNRTASRTGPCGPKRNNRRLLLPAQR